MLALFIWLICTYLVFFVFQDSSYFKEVLNFARLDTRFCLEFFEEDDSDIKIAGKESKTADQDEILAELRELSAQKGNGNLARAKKLGVRLSDEITKIDGESAFGLDPQEGGEILTQRSLMLAFAACYGIETYLPDKIIQKAALNAFYNTLKENHAALYETLKSSGAFSFYYLCVRRESENDVNDINIGKTFAMLCEKEGDALVEEFGQALFIRFTDTIRHIIAEMQFQN